jgi:DNA polymerase III delta prime subunit
MILESLNKDNLHHAYLIEGVRDEVVPEFLKFLKTLDIDTKGNPDFTQIIVDNFKIDEAFSLRSMSTDKSFSSAKKIFIVCVNSFSLDAQNVLLKMFEEPTENTIFFLVVPDINILLKTLVSRFYLISTKPELATETKEAEKFIALPLQARINFIKELLAESEEEDEDGNEIVVLDSARSKALKFLNALEDVIHNRLLKNSSNNSLIICCEHFLKVREFLRMPGSSTKSLMESVALIIPEKI